MKAYFTILAFILFFAPAARLTGSILYVATPIGPYQSTDSGATWKQLFVDGHNAFLPSTLPDVGGLATDPKNPSAVYFMRAGPSGFYRSSDGAKTWSAVVTTGYTLTSARVNVLAIDPVMTNVIYAIAFPESGNVILKSTDYGSTWAPTTHVPLPAGASAGSYPSGVTVTSITADPSISGVLYATAAAVLYKTTDFGSHWSQVASQKNTGGLIARVYIDPRNSKIVYASSNATNCGGSNGFFCGVLKSSDAGNSWTQLNLPATEVQSLAIDGSSGAIYAGATITGLGLSVAKSTDGGNTWTPLSNQFSAGENTGLIVRVDSSVPSTVYALPGNGDRIYKSTDAGGTWAAVPFPPACTAANSTSCTGIVFASDVVVAPPAPAAPNVSEGGIVNNASFAPSPSPVAPGAIAAIFGTGLDNGSQVLSSAFGANGKLVTTLGGASVTVGGIPAPMFYATPGQLGIQIPIELAGQTTADVQVTVGGLTSQARGVALQSLAPGLFTASQDGKGAAICLHSDGKTPVTAANPAHPSEQVVFYGTGLGAVNPPLTTGQPGAGNKTVVFPTMTIDGFSAEVVFSGAPSGFAGLYQLNVVIPELARTGSADAVLLSIGGVAASPVTLPVGPR